MWQLDNHGTPLDDADAAREELRRRAWLAISDGLKSGLDVRHRRVRVRDQEGGIVFEGTLAEAIANETKCPVLAATGPGSALVSASRRIRHQAAMNRQALQEAGARLAKAMALASTELQIAQQLIVASRS